MRLPHARGSPTLRRMAKIDPKSLPETVGSRYPAPYDEPCKTRRARRIGDAAGLRQFGVNLVTLPPGAWSSQRHWHAEEDELVYVLSGEVTMCTDAGDELLHAGQAAGFPAGSRDGHCFKNESTSDVVLLVVGSRNDADWGEYPDIDLAFGKGRYSGTLPFTKKDGSPV